MACVRRTAALVLFAVAVVTAPYPCHGVSMRPCNKDLECKAFPGCGDAPKAVESEWQAVSRECGACLRGAKNCPAKCCMRSVGESLFVCAPNGCCTRAQPAHPAARVVVYDAGTVNDLPDSACKNIPRKGIKCPAGMCAILVDDDGRGRSCETFSVPEVGVSALATSSCSGQTAKTDPPPGRATRGATKAPSLTSTTAARRPTAAASSRTETSSTLASRRSTTVPAVSTRGLSTTRGVTSAVLTTRNTTSDAEWSTRLESQAFSCFPAEAVVEGVDGRLLQMDALRIGDTILTSAGFEKVFMFTHSDSEARTSFVMLRTKSGERLSLSPGHYVFVGGSIRPATDVRTGDVLSLRDGGYSPVVEVSSIVKRGLYNPHTSSGDMFVNGILVSTYTTAVPPLIAHALLWPLRSLSQGDFESARRVVGMFQV